MMLLERMMAKVYNNILHGSQWLASGFQVVIMWRHVVLAIVTCCVMCDDNLCEERERGREGRKEGRR